MPDGQDASRRAQPLPDLAPPAEIDPTTLLYGLGGLRLKPAPPPPGAGLSTQQAGPEAPYDPTAPASPLQGQTTSPSDWFAQVLRDPQNGPPIPPPNLMESLIPVLGPAWEAAADIQNGPTIPRPNLLESFIPLVGPAWEAASDLQNRNYGAALFNSAAAMAEAPSVAVAAKGLNSLQKGITPWRTGSMTSNAAVKAYRQAGMAKAGEDVHHTVALNGIKRNVPNWRNHYAFLKPLPEDIHQRLTRTWKGVPPLGPLDRLWYGTTDWMKALPLGLAGYTADAVQNLTHPYSPPPPSNSIYRQPPR